MIKLIINADDFGMSKVFNEKILDLLKRRIISSTTVMVESVSNDQDTQVKELIRLADKSGAGIGLHLELDPEKPIQPQVEARYKKFTNIFGFMPEHLDLHTPGSQKPLFNLHWGEIDPVIDSFAAKKDLPYRNHGKIKLSAKTTSQPFFNCSNMEFEEIVEYVDSMKDGESYELLFHPGAFDPASKSRLNKERFDDYQNVLKMDHLLKTKKQIKVIRFSEL